MNNLTPRICLFLDIDGVMNQYRHCERIRRCRSKKISRSKCFDPFPKKVQRLSKLIKNYNIDMFIYLVLGLKKNLRNSSLLIFQEIPEKAFLKLIEYLKIMMLVY